MKKHLSNVTLYSPKDLLRLYGSILFELKCRGLARTINNPVSDYTEWLVSEKLNLKLASKSEKGFDATDRTDGSRYEIKARRITSSTNSRQLSAIRDLEGKHFDFLIAVIYDENFEVLLALKIPHMVVLAKSKFVAATNSYKLEAKASLQNETGVEVITQLLLAP